MDNAENTEVRPEPYHIRITNHGKIRAWVEFALDHFKGDSDQPLSLHTLPSPKQPQVESDGVAKLVAASEKSKSGANPRAISVSTTTIPRLLSVVEIIKREHIKYLDIVHSPVLTGLHQYNELGHLEQHVLDMDVELQPENRAQEIAMALEGKNYPKEKKSAYMRITLSKTALPYLVEQGATYQPPCIRKLSKSAKARARKRQRRGVAEGDAENTPEVVTVK